MNRDTIYRVSLDVFLSGVKLSQGFYAFIYLCTLPTHHRHVSKGRVCLYTLRSTHSTLRVHAAGWWTVSGPCRLQVAFSFNPFVSAWRGAACSFLFSATRFATTGPKKSLPRNLRRNGTDVNLSGSSDCSSNCGHCCENHVTGRVSWLSNLAVTDGDLIAAKGLRQR